MSENDIRIRVSALDHAYALNDLNAYFAFFADHATIMVPGFGRWTKADYRGKWSGAVARGGGVEATTISDLQAKISPSGDAAITTYVMDVTYRGLQPDQPADFRDEKRLLMTEVWFRHDTNWLIEHMDWSTVEQR